MTGISGEDYDFVLSCFFEAQSYSAIDDVFYIYRRGQKQLRYLYLGGIDN
ncbi:MAG: hypothetical protein L6V88_09355 [Anaerotruncus sp.]|nr:MAG: hypothetical protein L6V88_09355 [Anaerotruncus sp.]